MDIKHIEDLLKSMDIFADMDMDRLKWIAGCGINEQFDGRAKLFQQGQDANSFYIIRSGRIELELETQDLGLVHIDTIGENDIVGWSWLVPPYRWYFNARAAEPVHVIRMDARCIRQKCEEDPALGYDLMKRFAGIMTQRLNRTREKLKQNQRDRIAGQAT